MNLQEVNQILDTFTGDGATRTFMLSNAPENPNSLLVKLDNVEKKLNKDYKVFGNTIQFTTAFQGYCNNGYIIK